MRDEYNATGRNDLQKSVAVPSKRKLSVDVEKYQAFLDGSDMTDVQKEEFLQALWSIIVNFVDLGFGVHPAQEVCGKAPETGVQAAKESFDEVSSTEP
jgi:hypothetical protein